jgi:hypothetical protein
MLRKYPLPAATRKLQKPGFGAHHGDAMRDSEHKSGMRVWLYWVRDSAERGTRLHLTVGLPCAEVAPTFRRDTALSDPAGPRQSLSPRK